MKIFFSYDTTLNVSTVLNNHLTAKVNFMKIIDEKNWKCFLDKINYYNMTHNLEKSRIKIQPKTFSLVKKKTKKVQNRASEMWYSLWYGIKVCYLIPYKSKCSLLVLVIWYFLFWYWYVVPCDRIFDTHAPFFDIRNPKLHWSP